MLGEAGEAPALLEVQTIEAARRGALPADIALVEDVYLARWVFDSSSLGDLDIHDNHWAIFVATPLLLCKTGGCHQPVCPLRDPVAPVFLSAVRPL